MAMANFSTNLTAGGMDNETLLKCECEQFDDDLSASYKNFNWATILVGMPMVAIFGVVSNILNVIIYSKPQLCKSSGNVYLLALACSDFFVVILGGCTFWCDSGKTQFRSGPVISLINSVLVRSLPIGYIAQTASVYFTLVAAFDCYVAVCWRRATPFFCTVKRAKQLIIAVVLWSFVYNLIRFFTLDTQKCLMTFEPAEEHNETNEPLVEIMQICTNELYQTINSFYNVYLYLIMMTMFPFMLLSILNALIIKNVQMRRRFFAVIYMRRFTVRLMSNGIRREQNPNETDNSGDSESEENTITLIMVVLLFLVCNTLALVVNMVENFFPMPDGDETIHYMTDVSNFLVIFNSSANFIIYVRYTDPFRDVIVGWLHSCCGQQAIAERLECELSGEQLMATSSAESQPLQVRIAPATDSDGNYMAIVREGEFEVNGNGQTCAKLHVTSDSDYYL